MSFEYRRNPNFDSSKPRIAGILREHGMVSSTAFVNLIYDDIKSKGSNFLDVQAILNAARRHNVPEDEELWTGVFEEGFEDYNTAANRSLILAETRPPIGTSGLANTLRDIYSSNPDGLVLTQQAYAKRQELAQRNAMIRELTVNGSFVVVRPSGEKVRFDVSGRPIEFTSNGMTPVGGRGRESDPGFEGMDFDDLKKFYDAVMEQRRLQSLSKEELRREINPQRQRTFEASSRSLQVNPAGVDLIDPNTGAVISDKRTLIRVINSSADATKRMLTRNGVTDRTLARRFEELLNS
jgi:hypothetical protein